MNDSSELILNQAMLEIEKDILAQFDDAMDVKVIEEGTSINSNIVAQITKTLEKQKENIGKPGMKSWPEIGFQLFLESNPTR